jgi:hypothetical protein
MKEQRECVNRCYEGLPLSERTLEAYLGNKNKVIGVKVGRKKRERENSELSQTGTRQKENLYSKMTSHFQGASMSDSLLEGCQVLEHVFLALRWQTRPSGPGPGSLTCEG